MNEDAVENLRLALIAIDADKPPPIPSEDTDGAKKMLTIVTAEDADTTVDHRGLRVRWTHKRKPAEYFSSLAPHLISLLRSEAPHHRLDHPFTLRTPLLRRLIFGSRTPERWLWASWSSDGISINCRKPIASTRQPTTAPELPYWAPAPVRVAVFRATRRCLACGTESTRFRLLSNALICLNCGCSERTNDELERGLVVEDAG